MASAVIFEKNHNSNIKHSSFRPNVPDPYHCQARLQTNTRFHQNGWIHLDATDPPSFPANISHFLSFSPILPSLAYPSGLVILARHSFVDTSTQTILHLVPSFRGGHQAGLSGRSTMFGSMLQGVHSFDHVRHSILVSSTLPSSKQAGTNLSARPVRNERDRMVGQSGGWSVCAEHRLSVSHSLHQVLHQVEHVRQRCTVRGGQVRSVDGALPRWEAGQESESEHGTRLESFQLVHFGCRWVGTNAFVNSTSFRSLVHPFPQTLPY